MIQGATITVLALIFTGFVTPGFSQIDSEIFPEWIKTTIKFWAEGMMTDTELKNALEYMIKNKIIKVDEPSKGFEDVLVNELAVF